MVKHYSVRALRQRRKDVPRPHHLEIAAPMLEALGRNVLIEPVRPMVSTDVLNGERVNSYAKALHVAKQYDYHILCQLRVSGSLGKRVSCRDLGDLEKILCNPKDGKPWKDGKFELTIVSAR